jgi:hypothetical protein
MMRWTMYIMNNDSYELCHEYNSIQFLKFQYEYMNNKQTILLYLGAHII